MPEVEHILIGRGHKIASWGHIFRIWEHIFSIRSHKQHPREHILTCWEHKQPQGSKYLMYEDMRASRISID